MGRFGVELLLVAFAVITALGFIVTYIISVERDHVTPDLPYISDTGGKPPESCVFSLVCNVAILFDGVTTFCIPIKVINIISLLIGLTSAFGFLLVANFQNDYVPTVHFIGAFVVFLAGLLYQGTQTYISFRIYRSGIAKNLSKYTVMIQAVICAASLVFVISALTFGLLALKYHKEKHHQGTFHWPQNSGGFVFHVISTASEWCTSIMLLLFFFTFHSDFQQIRLDIRVRWRSQISSYETSVNETTPLTY